MPILYMYIGTYKYGRDSISIEEQRKFYAKLNVSRRSETCSSRSDRNLRVTVRACYFYCKFINRQRQVHCEATLV